MATTLQINPLLIHQLLDQETLHEQGSPTAGTLPGNYVKTVLKNINTLTPIIEKNNHMLTCKSCGRKGKYDVGMLVVNVDKKTKTDNIADNIQMTGYFRCKHCNSAGNWELPNSLLMQSMVSVLPYDNGLAKQSMVGKNLLFDGSWHRYTTDAEDYLLDRLKENPQDSYVWNRLGNLYHKGNRPDLAVSVFEHSISLDQGQAESHFTIGSMLSQISDLPNAGYHFRQMLLVAEKYKKMPAENLREMLANGLRLLFMMHDHTNGEVPFLPTADEIKGSGRGEAPVDFAEMELEIFPEDVESFFPLAEMYMGTRAKEIPIRKRTFKLTTSTTSFRKKKKKVKKKKKK
jgi:hypothetical protein